MPYDKLTKEIKKRVQKLPYVDAFYIHGSRAVGRHTKTSDIDYTVLVKDIKHKKDLEKELKDLLEIEYYPGFYGDDYWEICVWKEKKLDIGWHVIETKLLTRLVTDIFKSKRNLLKLQDHAQFLIIESLPVHDPKKILAKFKAELKKYPKELADSIVKDCVKKLRIKEWWLGDPCNYRNPFNFILDMKEILQLIATAHYARNRKFMMNSLKRWHQDLKTFKPDIEEDLYNLTRIDNRLPKTDKSVFLRDIVFKLKKR
ncbi:nucleotidyltransferase domain-containing protein [Candidatus Woesearchaeota archaeon]|nr:nucleotidyltransferase domain-containing protein [Candidatus Woesearchaeota archaeon]